MSSKSDRDDGGGAAVPAGQVPDAETAAAGDNAGRFEDIPDRLLILATRLQKALDARRARTSRSKRMPGSKN